MMYNANDYWQFVAADRIERGLTPRDEVENVISTLERTISLAPQADADALTVSLENLKLWDIIAEDSEKITMPGKRKPVEKRDMLIDIYCSLVNVRHYESRQVREIALWAYHELTIVMIRLERESYTGDRKN